jgi:hypothetical protein
VLSRPIDSSASELVGFSVCHFISSFAITEPLSVCRPFHQDALPKLCRSHVQKYRL